MPNPKRRHSKARRDKRRAHDALTPPALSECPNCHEPKQPHRVCPHCGHYKGKQTINAVGGIPAPRPRRYNPRHRVPERRQSL